MTSPHGRGPRASGSRSAGPRRRWRAPVRAVAVLVLTVPALVGVGGPLPSSAAPAPSSATPRGSQALDELRRIEEQARAELQGSTAAVQAAGVELARVAAELPGAEQAASVARGELAGARAKAAAARAAADRAERARVAAAAEVDRADAEVQRTRDEVDALARMAYQRGRLGGVGEVLSATEPQDALVRSEMLRSVFRSGTASLDRITSARLALAATRARLAAEEKAAAAARARADDEEARATRLSVAAAAAVQRVQGLIAARQSALATAESARADDRRAYEKAQAESRAMAEKIRRAEAAARAAAARVAAERKARDAAARAAAARAGQNAGGGAQAVRQDAGWRWPTNGRITSRYGWRTHPIYGDRRFHAGVDIAGGAGALIVATEDAVVLSAGPAGGYGNYTVLSHGDNVTSTYAHQSAILVRAGQTVRRGQVIGRVGSTGNVTGPHLHFEIRVNGDPVDPLRYVSPP